MIDIVNQYDSRPLRVFHVLTNLDLGGAQASVSLIALKLLEVGMDVQVAYSSTGGRSSLSHNCLIDRLNQAQIPLHDIKSIRRDIGLLRDCIAFSQLKSLFARTHPDVVHTHMSKAGFIGRWAAHSAGVPAVVHSARGWAFQSNTSPLKRFMFVHLERLAARWADAIAAVSSKTLEDGLAAGIGKRDQYSVIRTGIDTDYFSNTVNMVDPELRIGLDIPKDTKVVGTVMGISPSKAPLEFLEVCRILIQQVQNLHVIVVGDGEMRKEFEDRIVEMEFSDRFHLVGLHEDIRPYLALFDVFLLTSRWEGLPRVVLEALSAEIPVVATNVGGTSELMRCTDRLALSEPGDFGSLSRNVLDFIESDRAGSTSKRVLPAEYDISQVIMKHIDLYNRILQRKRRGIYLR